jgi:hypothetical protein
MNQENNFRILNGIVTTRYAHRVCQGGISINDCFYSFDQAEFGRLGMPLANLKFSSSKQSQYRVHDFPERENTSLYHQGEVCSIIQVSI